MKTCDVQASGVIETYVYGEASAAERAVVQQHLTGCAECRRAIDDLSVIRMALSARPAVAAPPGEDWSGFMARLDEAVRRAPSPAAASVTPLLRPSVRRSYVAWVAMAALIALVTFSVLFVARTREGASDAAAGPMNVAARPAVTAPAPLAPRSDENDAAFLAMSEKHFERSKLVVLGLATRDARESSGPDWAYERQLASSLLNDTRLYRIAAEQRGMTTLARVMGDLELVLLQTSMSDNPEPDTLEQLQRLIRKRDLVTKMEVVRTTGL